MKLEQKSIFNNNAKEKLQHASKCRQVLLFLLLLHHLYALHNAMALEAVLENTKLSEEVRAILNMRIEMGLRFLTTWNFIGQTLYLVVELALLHLPSTQFTRRIEKLSWMHFIGVVWPTTAYILGLYWSLYNYDRELIFPRVCDIIMPPEFNHSMHTMIVALLMLEAYTSTRTYLPNAFKMGVINFVYMFLYFAGTQFTYHWNGVWLYPFLASLTWTQRYLFCVTSFAVAQMFIKFGFSVFGRRIRATAESEQHKVE